MTTNKIKICLFFTYDISLKKWDELGILDREVILYKNLVNNGIEVAFFTYGGKEDLFYQEKLPGIKIIPAYLYTKYPKNKKMVFLKTFWFPIKFKKEFSYYNILKTNQMWGAWVPLLAKWISGNRLIVRCGYEHYYTMLAERRAKVERIIFYLFSKIVYFFSDKIVVTTNKIARFIVINFSVSREKIIVVPNFVDTALFNRKESVCPEENRIIYVGRLSKQKNLFSLIEACSKVGIGLDLIGDGELKLVLKKRIQDKKSDVRLLGVYPNSQLPDIFSRYKIFVLCSFFEGNPKALIEAMSCGKAVIGTNVNGINELLKNGENGILCGNKSDEIASAIVRVKNDIKLQEKLGKNAREYVINNFDINKISHNEYKLYCSIIKKK